MTATLALDHPETRRLEAYALGTLSLDDATELESHLATCDTCRGRLSAIPDDPFVALLRGASPSDVSDLSEDETVMLRDAAQLSSPPDFTFGSRAEPDPSPDDAPTPGALLDHPRYRVLGRCGVGGMGVVYRAEHRVMGREVALKVIRPDLLRRPEAADRFRREVRAAAALSHPNIVAAFDAEEADGLHFLVMEYVPGSDLASVVAGRGPLPVKEACDYVRQAALGLAHAHERGMVHRDIKPQNLMLTPDGRVKILDFGLSKFASEADDPPVPSGDTSSGRTDLTSSGTALGTPDYVAPEQTADARVADIRADIYGLGGTLYFLLTGRPPFPGRGVAETLRDHAEREPRPVSDFRDDLPAGLTDVLRRMTAKQPDDRYQTPTEVAEALRPFVLDAGTEGVSLGAMPPASPPAPDGTGSDDARQRVESPANGILAVAVLNLVLGVWSLSTMPHVYPEENLWSIWAAVGGISMIPATLVMMQGALRMRRLESYNWAYAAAIYAVIPWTPVWLLGLPMGLWALWMLARSDVRRGFGLEPLSPPARRRRLFLTGLFTLLPTAAGTAGIVYVETDEGTIAIETHDPNVRVTVLKDGEVVEILDPTSNQAVRIDVGVYTVRLGGDDDGLAIEPPQDKPFLIHRGKTKIVTVRRERPEVPAETKDDALAWYERSDEPLNMAGVEWDKSEDAWRIDGWKGRNVRLYQVNLADIDDRMLVYRAKLKTRDVTGRAYLEMWVRAADGRKYFSRGFDDAVRGTSDWVEVQTPFFLKDGERADQADLNLVIEGGGTVWIKDIALLSEPRPGTPAESFDKWLRGFIAKPAETDQKFPARRRPSAAEERPEKR